VIIGHRYGWQAPVSIFTYLAGSTYLVEVIFPVFKSWRENGKKMAESYGLYRRPVFPSFLRFSIEMQKLPLFSCIFKEMKKKRSAMTRLGEKAEAVATLQGAWRELQILTGKFATHMDDCVCPQATC